MTAFLRREWPSLLALAANLAFALWALPRLPERYPVHYNLAGEVDRYGTPAEVLLWPGLALGLYLLFLLLPRLDPGARRNAAVLAAARLATSLTLLLVEIGLAASALGSDISPLRLALLALGLTFTLLGNVMGKARPSLTVGARTPWTFASDRSWRRTNRASGWAFTLTGLGALALGLLVAAPPFWLPLALVALVLLEALALTRLSYLEWRADPERRPLGSRPA